MNFEGGKIRCYLDRSHPAMSKADSNQDFEARVSLSSAGTFHSVVDIDGVSKGFYGFGSLWL